MSSGIRKKYLNILMNYRRIQNSLEKQKGLGLYTKKELEYVQTPIGSALYKTKKIGRPKTEKPAKWNDRVKCDVCGDEFTRSGRTNHNKTRHHQDFLKMNKKIRTLLLEKSDN